MTENHGLQVTGAEQRVYCHDLEQAYLQLQADAKLIETLIAGPAKGQGLAPGPGLGLAPGLASGSGLASAPGPGLAHGLGPGQELRQGPGIAPGQGQGLGTGQGQGPVHGTNPVVSLRSEIEKIRCRIRELEERLLDATLCVGALAVYSRKEKNRADELASQVFHLAVAIIFLFSIFLIS